MPPQHQCITSGTPWLEGKNERKRERKKRKTKARKRKATDQLLQCSGPIFRKHKALLKQTEIKTDKRDTSISQGRRGGKNLTYFPEKVIYFGIYWGEGEEGKEEPQYSSGFLDQQLLEIIFMS